MSMAFAAMFFTLSAWVFLSWLWLGPPDEDDDYNEDEDD